MTQLYRIKASVTDEMLDEYGIPLHLRRELLTQNGSGLYMEDGDLTPWSIDDDWMEEVKQESPTPAPAPSLDEKIEAMRREIYIRQVSRGCTTDFQGWKGYATSAAKAYYEEE